jgi:hypothetical protein
VSDEIPPCYVADGLLVEFDLDSGPVIDGIYPPLTLLPSESENMCVCPDQNSRVADDSTVHFAHFQTRCNSIRALKPIHSAFVSNIHLRQRKGQQRRMASFTGFRTLCNVETHRRNEDISRYAMAIVS